MQNYVEEREGGYYIAGTRVSLDGPRGFTTAGPETAFFLDESGCAARQFSDRI